MATAVDPYKAYAELYQKRTDAINAQTDQAKLEKRQREQQAEQTLEGANRGVYTTYKQAINPYGSFASQNNFSSGVSDYYKNASYGTMLKGIGTNQYNYNDAMNNSNSLWQNYLSQKAGQEADALNDYNEGVLAQQKYDKEKEDAERERQEAIRQFNLNLQLQQEAAAQKQKNWEAEMAWAREQWEAEQKRLDEAAKKSGSGGGGSSYTSPGYDPTDNGGPAPYNMTWDDYLALTKSLDNPNYKSGAGAQDSSKSSPTVKSTRYEPSSISGKAYKVTTYSDGSTKRTLVNYYTGARF